MRIVDAIPFAIGADREKNVRAASVLDAKPHHRALLILEDISRAIEHRHDGNRQARMRDVGGERVVVCRAASYRRPL